VPEPLVVVPDDFPSVFEGTSAHERLKKLGEARVYTARGAEDEAELTPTTFQASSRARRPTTA